MATVRLRRESVALYTSPIPPAPRGETISYGPNFVPGRTGMDAADYRRRPGAAAGALKVDGELRILYADLATDLWLKARSPFATL